MYHNPNMKSTQLINTWMCTMKSVKTQESHRDTYPFYIPLFHHLIQVLTCHSLTHQTWVLDYHSCALVSARHCHMSLNIHQSLTKDHSHRQLYNIHYFLDGPMKPEDNPIFFA